MKTADSILDTDDLVIAEVRRHKEAIASEHHFDIDSLLKSLRERQKDNSRLANRSIKNPENPENPV